jgi:hypothetical protein
MTKILNFQSELGPFAIELLDNLFVNQWLEHFLKTVNKYHITSRSVQWPVVTNNVGSNKCIENLMKSIGLANSLTYISPLPEIVTKDQLSLLNLDTQKLLNRLHRYCVTASETRNRWIINQEPTFEWVPYEIEEFNYVVDLINQSIHWLELYVHTPNKDKFCEPGWRFTEFIFKASKYDDVTVYHDDIDVSIADDMFKYLRLSGYDVWIKKDLLGKDFITGFADHDDPSEVDIRPPTMYSGGIQIDNNNGKNIIYESPEFINWLGKHPDDFHGNFPLGNVIKNKQNTLAKQIKFVGISDSSQVFTDPMMSVATVLNK